MQDFIQFVASQPRDKIIDHTSWHSCAIGDYADSIDQLPPRADGTYAYSNVNPDSWSPQMNVCIDSLQDLSVPNTDGEMSILSVLCAGEINSDAPKRYEVETYGGLHDFIKWCIKKQ